MILVLSVGEVGPKRCDLQFRDQNLHSVLHDVVLITLALGGFISCEMGKQMTQSHLPKGFWGIEHYKSAFYFLHTCSRHITLWGQRKISHLGGWSELIHQTTNRVWWNCCVWLVGSEGLLDGALTGREKSPCIAVLMIQLWVSDVSCDTYLVVPAGFQESHGPPSFQAMKTDLDVASASWELLI